MTTDKDKTAGEVLTAKQAPHRPGITPAPELRADRDVVSFYRSSQRRNMMKRRMFVASLALAALAVAMFAGSLPAGEFVPFKGTLEGDDQLVVPPPIAMVDSVGEGTATELGRFSYELLATVDFRVPPPHGEGLLTLTAADGSTLVAETDGFSTPLVPGVLVLVMEEAVIVDGTGRFAGASGAFMMERMVYQDTRLTVGSFEGTISIPGKR